jgi:hypothetical protein
MAQKTQVLGDEYGGGEFLNAEMEDFLGLEGDPEEVQEFFQHEDEADAANLDTFGDDAFIEAAIIQKLPAEMPDSHKLCTCLTQETLTVFTAQEFDFVAANRRFEQQKQFPEPIVQSKAQIKSIWDDPTPARQATNVKPKALSAADLEAQLLSNHQIQNQPFMMRPMMPGMMHQGVPLQGMPPQGIPPQGMAGMPPQGIPPQGMAGMPPQGIPPPGMAGMPPPAMQAMLMQAMRPMPGQNMPMGMPLIPPQILAQLMANRPMNPQDLDALMRMGPPPSLPPPSQQMPKTSPQMSVQELEREMLKPKPEIVKLGQDFGPTPEEAKSHPQHPSIGPLPPPSGGQKMSFGFAGGSGKPNYNSTPGFNLGQAGFQRPATFNSPEEKDAWERLRRGVSCSQFETLTQKDRYNQIFTNGDRDLITRIQLSQLYMQNPWDEDYYYQTYKRLKKDEPAGLVSMRSRAQLAVAQTLNEFAKGRQIRVNAPIMVTQKMQRRVMDWIKERGGRQKPQEYAKEGALGKVAMQTSKNPRQQLQIKALQNVAIAGMGGDNAGNYARASGPLSKYATLRRIEDVYRSILELEQRDIIGPPKLGQPRKPLEGETEEESAQKGAQAHEENVMDWEMRGDEVLIRLWEDLGVALPIAPEDAHPFVELLKYGKGKRALPRAMERFSHDQNLAVVTVLLSRFAELDVTQPGVDEDAVDTFMEHVFVPMVEVMSDAPLRLVNAWLRMILERVPMAQVVKSRIGLALASIILNRVEILKSSGVGQLDTTDEDMASWNELYQFVFNSLQGKFAHIFTHHRDSDAEFFVWHFLAALAVITPDDAHQHALVADLKDKLMETVRLPVDEREGSGVDSFLRVLGLESSQLQ